MGVEEFRYVHFSSCDRFLALLSCDCIHVCFLEYFLLLTGLALSLVSLMVRG